MVESANTGESLRRLRLGMVGGGIGAFIGAVHRFAIRLDDEAVLIAGAFSSDAERSAASGELIGIAPDRVYRSWQDMARAESARADGIEAVVIVTPNHLHAPISQGFLEAGIDVICDKPLSLTMEEADGLVALTRSTNRQFFVSLNNTGYAMVRQMRGMIGNGSIGRIRGIHAEYIQDWLSEAIDVEGQKQAQWRTDPAQAGPSAVLADIGVHAYNLAAFVSGLTLEAVAAQLTTAVEGRRLDDNANVLMRWSGGVTGTLIASQTAPGHFNDLAVRVFGEKGSLEWRGTRPEELWQAPLGEPPRVITRGGPGSRDEAKAVSRMPAAHPEGYIEGFANFYRDAVAAIRDHRDGNAPSRTLCVPDVVDGARGVKFVEASVRSHKANGAWTDASLTSTGR